MGMSSPESDQIINKERPYSKLARIQTERPIAVGDLFALRMQAAFPREYENTLYFAAPRNLRIVSERQLKRFPSKSMPPDDNRISILSLYIDTFRNTRIYIGEDYMWAIRNVSFESADITMYSDSKIDLSIVELPSDVDIQEHMRQLRGSK